MKKQILIASIIYTTLSILQPLSNFILLPIYTKFFSESEYGTFSILNNLNVFFSIIGGLSIVHAIIAFYSSYNNENSEKLLNKYIGNVLTFTIYFNLGLFLLISLSGNLIFGFIFKEHINFFPNGMLTVGYGLLTNTITGYLFFLKYERNLKRFAFISLTQFILNTILQYFFIVHLKMGVTGALKARVWVAFCCFLLVLIYHYKYIFSRLDFSRFIKPSLKYSINTIPSSVIAWFCSYGDRFLIERFIDLKSLGVYSFLSTISSLTEMGFLALGAALQPFIFDFFKLTDNHKIQRLYRMFLLLTACMASGIILLGSNLDLLVQNKGYLEMVKYLTVMTIGYIFSGISYLYNLQIIFAKKSRYFIVIGIIVLTTNLSLNAILIPVYGIWGAVISSSLTKLIGAISSFYFANKSYTLSFEKSNYLTLFILLSIMLFFWWLGNVHFLPFKITAMLQFLVVIISMFISYRKLIIQSYGELLASINQK